jgi:hypothetical protein
MAYQDEKEHGGATYRGMKVGGSHLWTYPDGTWVERKLTPQRWEVAFTSLKRRRRRAPEGSGAEVGSGYHWLIVAHQWVGKMDANTYATHLEGSKHLLAFRKPGWKGWTTQQKGHKSARLRTIATLEQLLDDLRAAPDDAFEDPRDDAALTSLVEGAASGPMQSATPSRAGKPATGKRRRSTSRPQRVPRAVRRPRAAVARATRGRRSSRR